MNERITIQVDQEVNGKVVMAETRIDGFSIDRFNCDVGDWFKQVLTDLRSGVAAEAKRMKQEAE